SFLTIPLALDLISTLVMGWILPVATTLLARSPFSTFASLVGSILVPPVLAATRPPTTTSTRKTVPMMIHKRLDFFLPFATVHSLMRVLASRKVIRGRDREGSRELDRQRWKR